MDAPINQFALERPENFDWSEGSYYFFTYVTYVSVLVTTYPNKTNNNVISRTNGFGQLVCRAATEPNENEKRNKKKQKESLFFDNT